MDFSLDEILEANQRCLRAGIHAPLLHLAGREVWLKAECLQPTGSFKVRGFLNAALSLEPENLARGLMTVSAGNAALACAYVANTLGVGCRVLTFDTIPAPKLAGIRAWGAEAVLRPRAEILDWMNQRGWESEQEAFIHPFLDRAVIAGSGGIGVELLAELPALARLLVPVGGGGLIAGIAIAVKAMRPSVEIIGVQSSGYPAWEVAMATGLSPVLPPQTIADGTTAPIDAGMLELLPTLVDRWVTVPEHRLRDAVAAIATQTHLVAEGAGALAYAALEIVGDEGVTAAVISGGNIDPTLLAELLAVTTAQGAGEGPVVDETVGLVGGRIAALNKSTKPSSAKENK